MIAGRRLAVAALAVAPLPALAHSFGQVYTLPVPVWLYLYGAAGALAVSFLVIGWFVATPAQAHRNFATRPLPSLDFLAAPGVITVLRALVVALLALCIATAGFGSRNPYANFSMTFFWIVFVLGYAYWTAIFGDSYAALNPWRTLTARGPFAGRWPYPVRLGYWPGLALYMAFIWIELFGGSGPRTLAWMLVAYFAITLLGCWAWGREAWFRHGDFFGVFFRITGKIAPVERVDGRFRLRQPFVGLLREPCESMSLLLFVLFMLSSTAFDGVHETIPWVRFFWQDVASLLTPWVGDNIVQSYPVLKRVYAVWQSGALFLSPLLYLAVFAALVALARRLGGSTLTTRELCLQFGYSLVPIAFVYHLTHYFTLAASQGPLVLKLLSDPFGWGWNLFGTARWFARPIVLDASTVWHTQVALILGGHIVSVYLAHLVALRLFPNPRAALLSQLPMLALMMIYTTSGLWILSLPIQSGALLR